MTIKKQGLLRSVLDEKINFPVTLAPMVGLSHSSFRRMLVEYLPEGAHTLWPTEMLNSKRLPNENLGFTHETLKHPLESEFLVPQILGNEEEPIRQSIIKLQDWGARGIDINMGCPVAKALKHNYGVSLLGDPLYASQVVAMTKKHSALPISVKLRAMESGDKEELLQFVLGLIHAGASWLTLHPRRGSQKKRRGNADWEQIAWLREKISCALIGNGDIQTSDDVHRMLRETHCDMVMIGRALTARPWIFWQLGEDWGWCPPKRKQNLFAPRTPQEEAKEYGHCLKVLLNNLSEDIPSESLVLRKFLFFVKTGSVWLDFGQELYGLVHKSKTVLELKNLIDNFFKQDLCMVQRTELRQ